MAKAGGFKRVPMHPSTSSPKGSMMAGPPSKSGGKGARGGGPLKSPLRDAKREMKGTYR